MGKYYSGQICVMGGMLGELILNGVTWWFFTFSIGFIALTIINLIGEIKD